MVLVAIAMVAIIAMAALSIDVITLYLAREEAQRSADAAALAAARVISLSGITSDPNDSDSTWAAICGPSGSATQTAQAVATQSAVGGAAGTVTVTYAANGVSNADCTTFPKPNGAFGVNPIVNVQVQRLALPTFFSRIWGNPGNSVTATATAEAFNPSNSGNVGNVVTGTITPVQPRCVKPWMVPNLDPRLPNTSCTAATGPNACHALVSPTDGHVMDDGKWPTGVAGERFLLIPNCRHRVTGSCSLRSTPTQANFPTNGGTVPNFPDANLEFLPGQTVNTSVAVPAGASGAYEQAIAGCDQTTVYYCGVPSGPPVGSGLNRVDLGTYPADDTSEAVAILIGQGNANPNSQPTGQDYFNPYGTPTYPLFSSTSGSQILAGSGNPLVVKAGLTSGTPITASNSIVTVPIFDQNNPISPAGTSPVTILGFLQLFINGVDQYGNMDVTVLNAAGCGGNATGTAVSGSSPVPVRLITPP
jgi:Putative Flp pilus-assembly TadE/G-like